MGFAPLAAGAESAEALSVYMGPREHRDHETEAIQSLVSNLVEK
jgi:hypothetical protein